MSELALRRIAENITNYKLRLPAKHLSLNDCKIETLPNELKECVWLEYLDLSGNTQLSDLTLLTNLPRLRTLRFHSTGVYDIRPIAALTKLQRLDCYYTLVSDIKPLAELNNISILNIWSTKVDDLEPLKHLVIKGVPIKINDNYQSEGGIYVQNCPLDSALIAAIKGGQQSVLAYFNKPKERLFEARVLILGEPRAGKTTLRRKLKDTNASMPNENESTKGVEIEIESYKCKIQLDVAKYDMKYYLWDFGGQEMYRLLHQLFVAEQSVYVIVTDTDRNKNEEELDFWLETIERLGKDKNGKYGPVILFQNAKTEREGSDFGDLKRRYPFWKQPEQFVANLGRLIKGTAEFRQSDKKIFSSFKKYLEKSFLKIDHVGKLMPSQWIRIREELTKYAKDNHIGLEQFRKICTSQGVVNPREQDDLVSTFHILGYLLHYKNSTLQSMVILNKEWVTDSLYRVLDDPIIHKNKGWFRRSDAEKIWNEQKYKDRAIELLTLMNEFKLSYYNKRNQKYIVPAKLPETQIHFPEWDIKNNVRLYLQYDWLPRALTTQLVVSLHDYIEEFPNGEQWIWRKGAVLSGKKLDYKDTQVRIEDNWRDRRIEIYGKGQYSEYLIRTVIEEWKTVHEPYADKLEVSKIILCSCEACMSNYKPFEFEYNDVLEAKHANETLRCNKSRKDFEAGDILKGIFDAEEVKLDLLNLYEDEKVKDEIKLLGSKVSSYFDKLLTEIHDVKEYSKGHFELLKQIGASQDELQVTQLALGQMTNEDLEKLKKKIRLSENPFDLDSDLPFEMQVLGWLKSVGAVLGSGVSGNWLYDTLKNYISIR